MAGATCNSGTLLATVGVDISCSSILSEPHLDSWRLLPLSFALLSCASQDALESRTLMASSLARQRLQLPLFPLLVLLGRSPSQLHSNPAQSGSCKSPRQVPGDALRRECNRTTVSNLPPVYMGGYRHHRLDATVMLRSPDISSVNLQSSSLKRQENCRW